jgi:Putative transposase/Transposase zinc-binding domain
VYERHQPECTLLYRLIEQHYPDFVAHLAEQDRALPKYVQSEFEEYLQCGILAHGFLRVRCECCHHERHVAFSCKRRGFCPSCCAKRMTESAALLVDTVLPRQPMRQWVLSVPYPLRLLFARQPLVMSAALKIVYRTIESYLIRKSGETRITAHTGAVTLIQRFGSALNLNIHFHMLFLDGVFIDDEKSGQRFQAVTQHHTAEIIALTHKISVRLATYLERAGLIEGDTENQYLAEDVLRDNEMSEYQGFSVHYRISVGPQKGRKVFTLQTLQALQGDNNLNQGLLGNIAGFSLHAGVSAKANERDKLERLCRYIARPPVSTKRLSLTASGNIRYELKTPYRDGTTHIIFEPLDFISKLAALVPAPRVHLTRYHGVFAPNSKHRASVIMRPEERVVVDADSQQDSDSTTGKKRAAMTWAQCLKRAFKIDIELCEKCLGPAKVIACITDAVTINKILTHLQLKQGGLVVGLPASRAPPVSALSDS